MIFTSRWILLSVLAPTTLLAQNLYPNGDFNDPQQIAGWQATVGVPSHLDADASDCPLSGSFRAVCEEVIPGALYSLNATGPCQAVGTTGTLYVSWEYRGFGGAMPGSVDYHLEVFGNGTCAGAAVASVGFETYEAFQWQHFAGSVPIVAGRSVRAHVHGGSLDGCFADIDRILVTLEPHALLDDFEGGSTCRWSSSLPD